jgi:hypothetical protein
MIAVQECQSEKEKRIITFSACFVHVCKLGRRKSCDYWLALPRFGDDEFGCGRELVSQPGMAAP